MSQNTERELTEQLKTISEKDRLTLYNKAIELRKFEIENFWKRTLFFWGIIAIIYAGYLKAELNEYAIVLPLIGTLFNVIFSLSIRGSKYWQEHWETVSRLYENTFDYKLLQIDTKELIDSYNEPFLTKPFRFSVSKLTMLISDLSAIVWTFLWLKELISLFFIESLKIGLCFTNCSIHWHTVGILILLILLHTALISYSVIFLRKGEVYHSFKNKN